MHSSSMPLLALLRRRRALDPTEIALLLQELSVQIDAGKWEKSAPLLHQLEIGFSAARVDVPGIADVTVEKWPEWRLFISNEGSLPDGTMLASIRTIVAPACNRSGAAQLAILICELLGGGRRHKDGSLFFSPFPALNETGNDVLRRALADAYGDCESFWRDWVGSLGKAVSGAIWRVPRWLIGRSLPCDMIELHPERGSQPQIRLVARDSFRIGRSRSQADWPARVEVDGKLDEDSSKQVSRVHVSGEWTNAGPALRDGNGMTASANGSSIAGMPLGSDQPRLLPPAAVLDLGGAFRMECVYVREAGFTGVVCDGSDQLPEANDAELAGSVFILPLDGRDTIRDAVWIGSAVGFVISRSGQIRWNDGGEGENAGFFVRSNGRIWLANAAIDNGRMRVDDVPIVPGEIAPLFPGQFLEIASKRFTTARCP